MFLFCTTAVLIHQLTKKRLHMNRIITWMLKSMEKNTNIDLVNIRKLTLRKYSIIIILPFLTFFISS